jgi:hypothetical protein
MDARSREIGVSRFVGHGIARYSISLECGSDAGKHVKNNRSLIAKVVRANTEAIHFIKTDREGTKAIFSKFLKLKGPEGLERAAKAYAMIFPEIPMPTPEGVKTLLDDMAPRNPQSQNGRA